LLDFQARGEAEPVTVGPWLTVGTADATVGLVYRTQASIPGEAPA